VFEPRGEAFRGVFTPYTTAYEVEGVRVEHILSPGERRVHTLTPFADVQGVEITYPPR